MRHLSDSLEPPIGTGAASPASDASPPSAGDHSTPSTDAPDPRSLVISHYLNRFEDRISSPLTGAELTVDDALWPVVSTVRPGRSLADRDLTEADLRRLVDGGFLIDDPIAASYRSRLRYASLETCSVCNHRCAFCPVSIDPRGMEVMPQELFVRILDQLVEVAGPELGVFLNNYNEPTVDPKFLNRLEILFDRGVRTGLLSNGSRLTPETVDRIREMGRLAYFGLNLPTIDPDRYREMHGTTDLEKILGNLDYVLDHPIADDNAFVVLGYADQNHEADLQAIEATYADRGWEVRRFHVTNRAGLVEAPVEPERRTTLGGCDLMGSRPFEHLHVVASGKAVFCCQDYYEHHIIGDLTTQTVREVLASEAIAQLRRWTYGVEDAPDDFMCRGCEFSLGG